MTSLIINITQNDTPFHPPYPINPYGRFHVKGPRKKVNVKKWIFFYEMGKIIRKIHDFGRFLNNFCNFGVVLSQNQKYPKMTVLKVKIEKKIVFFLKIKRLNLSII